MDILYCIEHERMVKAEESNGTGLIHCEVADTPEPPFYEIDCCEFPMGWACQPPPAFDMQEFIDTVEEPSELEIKSLNYEDYFLGNVEPSL